MKQENALEKSIKKHLEKPKYPKFMLYFAGLYITSLIITAVMYHRFVLVDNVTEPGGNLIFPLMYFFGDLITEVYGYEVAKKLVWSAFLSDAFFSISTYLISNMSSPPGLSYPYYSAVFDPLPRMFVISSVAMSFSAWINVLVISKWKKLVNGKFFILRSIGSSAIGEGILSIISIPLIFSGKMNFSETLQLIASIYLFKITYSVVISVPGSGLVIFLKIIEKNTFNESINQPMQLS